MGSLPDGSAASKHLSEARDIEHAEAGSARLSKEFDSLMEERTHELLDAGRELVSFADSIDGEFGPLVAAVGLRIVELADQLVRLARVANEPRGGRRMQASGGFWAARTLTPVLAGVALVVAAGVVAAAIVESRSSPRPLGGAPIRSTMPPVFRSPLALLVALPANYTFDGGTPAEQNDVTQALSASSFNWNVIPQTVTIHIDPSFTVASSTLGNMWISPQVLDSGKFGWAVVQHEYAHQVDFGLLTDQMRATLQSLLGGKAWCYGGNGNNYMNVAGLPTIDYGCERFAEMISWAYWPSPSNSLQPSALGLPQAPLNPAKFRSLMQLLLSPGYSDLSTDPAVPAV